MRFFFLRSTVVNIEHRKPEAFSIDNSHLLVHLRANGLIEGITSNAVPGGVRSLDVQFSEYGVRASEERSGAYLFLPEGKGHELALNNEGIVRVIRGPLRQESRAFSTRIEHAVVVEDVKGSAASAVHVENVVDIRESSNYELAMRLKTNGSWLDNRGPSASEQEFYTDLNCYQLLRRVAFSKLPLQANVYPMPCAAMLEANGLRLTLLSAQPLGAGAFERGQLDVFLDRRLNQDDNRGLGEGVQVRIMLKSVLGSDIASKNARFFFNFRFLTKGWN